MKLVMCLLVIFHHSEILAHSPKIRISQGELQGTIEDSIIGGQYVAFRGIPYATPPIGNLRFLDPLPAGPWNGTLEAFQYKDYCPQPVLYFPQITGKEDCLYLNVYTPSDFNSTGSQPKSVMVWFHGDSFYSGSGNDELFGPDYLVAKDVIVVTMNYRLGVLGFLNLNDEVATGNQGLKDQVLALKWVQENIAHFGGNPDSVTIFGANSGAASVHYLALSPIADGLYHKVIAQGGTVLDPWAYLPYSQKIHAEELAVFLGNSTKDPKELVEFLRTIDATLLSSIVKLPGQIVSEIRANFVPSVDNKSENPFMPTPIATAAQNGVKVPFLLGDVSNGGIMFLALLDDRKLSTYNLDLEKALSPGVLNMLNNKGISVEQIRKFYFGDKAISLATRDNYVRMQTDLQFTYGIHDTVAIQVSKDYPTYMYRFSYDSGHSIYKTGFEQNTTGVARSEDINFLFYSKLLSNVGFPPPAPGTTAQLVLDRVTQMWTDFAKIGDPTPNNTTLVPIKWEPVENADFFNVMDISENLKMEKVENINNRNLTEIQQENLTCQFETL